MTSQKRVLVAGKLIKERGTVRSASATEPGFSGVRWGWAAQDCRSARHTHSVMCATISS